MFESFANKTGLDEFEPSKVISVSIKAPIVLPTHVHLNTFAFGTSYFDPCVNYNFPSIMDLLRL